MVQIFQIIKKIIKPDIYFFSDISKEYKVLNFGCGKLKDDSHIGIDIDKKFICRFHY